MATIKVPVNPQDPSPDEKPQFAVPPNPETGVVKGLSSEDIALRDRLELAVERLKDPSEGIQKNALELIGKELRESTRCGVN